MKLTIEIHGAMSSRSWKFFSGRAGSRDGVKQRRFSVGCDTSNFAATLIKPCLRHDDERWYGIHTFRGPFMNLIHKSLPIPPASHLLT